MKKEKQPDNNMKLISRVLFLFVALQTLFIIGFCIWAFNVAKTDKDIKNETDVIAQQENQVQENENIEK